MKALKLSLAALALVVGAQAAEVQIDGYSRGCFYLQGDAACTPTADAVNVSQYGLQYTGAGFSGETVGQALSATAGYFTLSNLDQNYNNVRFRLAFFLTSPPPGGGNAALGTVDGAVSSGNSSVNVGYGLSHDSGNDGLFLYNIDGGSPLYVHIAPVSIQSSQLGLNVDQTVHFHGEAEGQIPEPGTYALMGAGLAGLALLRRKMA